MSKLFLLLTLLFAAGNCEKSQASDQETKIIYIGNTLQDCMGVGPQKCMQYRENPDNEWTYFYDTIKGFSFEEGYDYQLKVQVNKVPEPMADASSFSYELLEVISKEKATSKAQVGTATTTIQQMDLKTLAYEESSRGFYKRIEVNPQEIALFKDREGAADKTVDCNTTLWSAMQEMAIAADPTSIQALIPPSTGFSSDRAAHAILMMKISDTTYTSCTFDSGNPPEEIKAIVSEILALEKTLAE